MTDSRKAAEALVRECGLDANDDMPDIRRVKILDLVARVTKALDAALTRAERAEAALREAMGS